MEEWTTYFSIPNREELQKRFESTEIIDLDLRTNLFSKIAGELLTTRAIVDLVAEAFKSYEIFWRHSKLPEFAKKRLYLSPDTFSGTKIKDVVTIILRDHKDALVELEKLINASVLDWQSP